MLNGCLIMLKNLRHMGVRVGTSSLFYSGALKWLQRDSKGQRRVGPGWSHPFSPFSVLLYHRVNPAGDPYFPALSVEAFEAQIKYLAENFHVAALADIVGRITRREEIDPFTIAISFDDGYKDNYLYAHPVLRKYRLPATIFVATDFIGSDRMMWNDRLAWAFRHTERDELVMECGGQKYFFHLGTETDKIRSLSAILERLKALPEEEKADVLETLMEQLGEPKRQPEPMMLSWEEVRTMAAQGWEIGSHTASHVILTRIPEAQATTEVSRSKTILEQKLQNCVAFFAYPNGKRADFSPTTKRLLREVGYRAAATTLGSLNNPDVDPFEISRVSVWQEHLPSFALKMTWSHRSAMTGRPERAVE